ncbi:transferase spermidine synthase [Massilia sp. H6]|uniref:spermine/spermidine synthase domain-containing protein n=1 Tax=Massilia sp. H6 TaxID=2970464 RepID=UPI0021685027|nr:transferase spermidine synthase [Massilia sp. H6]UVW30244.1 transferase spermidine synthase [Massilia sp. H6]
MADPRDPRPDPCCEGPPDPAPIVSTEGDRRTLAFTPGDIQSEMRLSQPNALVLAYPRAMMCFALLVPRPQHIVMVGLGGGSLAKFCYRHFPRARITVLEVRADVIALRALFQVPPDDARLRVLHCDAAAWLAQQAGSADVLLVDGFDASGLPPALSSASFYTDCRRALRPGGVLVANIFSYAPDYVSALQRLQQIFGGHVCWLSGIAGNNQILFAQRPAHAAGAPGHALRLLRDTLGNRGLGAALLNRLLARTVVAWLARRGRSRRRPHP